MVHTVAYFGQEEIKASLVAQLEDDFQHGRIVQGDYWNGECGCLIGCTTRDRSHELYERMYNIPRSLAHLFDLIFERLSLKEAQQFTLDVHKVIPVGADLSLVLSHFLLWLLIDEQDGVVHFAHEQQGGKQAVEQVATLYRRKIAGDIPTGEEWREAYACARVTAYTSYASATDAAYASAADAVYAAAYAADAAYTQAYVSYAAYASFAADAASVDTSSYAYRNARQNHFRKMRDKLLALLALAPVPEGEGGI